jgi:hypothetical protein
MNTNDFLSFVDFIKDIDKYEQRVKVLNDENKRLEENIALTGKASEIRSLHAVAEATVRETNQALQDAKTEATKLKAEAKAYYDKKYADSSVKETEAAALLDKAIAAQKEAEQWYKDNNVKLEATLAEIEKLKQITLEEKQEVEARLEKLKAVMG